VIDFVSLDTEGSEYDILQSIDFSRYSFGLMAIEHNYVDEKRKLIYNMLKGMGYCRFSAKFDDWYYHPVYLNILNNGIRVDFNAVLQDFATEPGYGKEPL
jgi:hypothetical protein